MSDAQRSTKWTVTNNTSAPLTLASQCPNSDSNLADGIWNIKPPQVIAPNGGTGQWESESNGTATGTQGQITYQCPSGAIVFAWDNPFIGDNSQSVTPPNGLTGVLDGGGGDNALIVCTIQQG